jgi:hypothetical protein
LAELKEDLKGKKEFEEYLTKLSLQKADIQGRIEKNKTWIVSSCQSKQLFQLLTSMPLATRSSLICLRRRRAQTLIKPASLGCAACHTTSGSGAAASVSPSTAHSTGLMLPPATRLW